VKSHTKKNPHAGFYKLTLEQRQKVLRENTSLTSDDIDILKGDFGLKIDKADHMVENVIGVYSLPLGIATNFMINGRDLFIPMVHIWRSLSGRVAGSSRVLPIQK